MQDICQIPLGASLEDVLSAYGEPFEKEDDDTLPNTTTYNFEVEDRHLVNVTLWDSAVHQILYTSPHGNAELDLQTVLDAYGDDKEWIVVEEGYLLRNSDDSVRVWCSAMPVIGVGTQEFARYRSSFRNSAEEA